MEKRQAPQQSIYRKIIADRNVRRFAAKLAQNGKETAQKSAPSAVVTTHAYHANLLQRLMSFDREIADRIDFDLV